MYKIEQIHYVSSYSETKRQFTRYVTRVCHANAIRVTFYSCIFTYRSTVFASHNFISKKIIIIMPIIMYYYQCQYTYVSASSAYYANFMNYLKQSSLTTLTYSKWKEEKEDLLFFVKCEFYHFKRHLYIVCNLISIMTYKFEKKKYKLDC